MVNDDIVREYEEDILCRISVSDNGNKKRLKGFAVMIVGRRSKCFLVFGGCAIFWT
jgi:hypothetical protein